MQIPRKTYGAYAKKKGLRETKRSSSVVFVWFQWDAGHHWLGTHTSIQFQKSMVEREDSLLLRIVVPVPLINVQGSKINTPVVAGSDSKHFMVKQGFPCLRMKNIHINRRLVAKYPRM